MRKLKTVLVAEDEEADAVPLVDFLTDQGYSVTHVKTAGDLGEKAPEADALVVDIMLGEERNGGIAAVSKLIENGRLASTVPVIFWTVLAEKDCREELERGGVAARGYEWCRKDDHEYDFLVDRIRAWHLQLKERIKG